MAENPHSIGNTAPADKKLLRYDRLVKYNSMLLTQLGLVATGNATDIGKYAYAKYTGTDKATNVGDALSQLYDLISGLNSSKVSSVSGEVKTGEAGVILTVKDDAGNALTTFEFNSNDTNLAIGATMDIKSVTGAYDKTTHTLEAGGDTTATDPLTQKSYVDAKIEELKDNNTQTPATGKNDNPTATAAFNNDPATENDYYINVKVGDTSYDIHLDADDFLKDKVLKTVKIQTYAEAAADSTWTAADIAEFTATDANFKTGNSSRFILFKWETKHGAEASEYSYSVIDSAKLIANLSGGDGIKFDDSTISVDLAAQEHDYANLSNGTSGVDVTFDTANVVRASNKKTWNVEGSDTTTIETSNNLADVANTL